MKLRLSELQNVIQTERGIACRRCGCRDLRVVYTRPQRDGSILRLRRCRHCGNRFPTFERTGAPPAPDSFHQCNKIGHSAPSGIDTEAKRSRLKGKRGRKRRR